MWEVVVLLDSDDDEDEVLESFASVLLLLLCASEDVPFDAVLLALLLADRRALLRCFLDFPSSSPDNSTISSP